MCVCVCVCVCVCEHMLAFVSTWMHRAGLGNKPLNTKPVTTLLQCKKSKHGTHCHVALTNHANTHHPPTNHPSWFDLRQQPTRPSGRWKMEGTQRWERCNIPASMQAPGQSSRRRKCRKERGSKRHAWSQGTQPYLQELQWEGQGLQNDSEQNSCPNYTQKKLSKLVHT